MLSKDNFNVIQICIAGTRAEFEHRIDDARILYGQAREAQRYYELAVELGFVHQPD